MTEWNWMTWCQAKAGCCSVGRLTLNVGLSRDQESEYKRWKGSADPPKNGRVYVHVKSANEFAKRNKCGVRSFLLVGYT